MSWFKCFVVRMFFWDNWTWPFAKSNINCTWTTWSHYRYKLGFYSHLSCKTNLITDKPSLSWLGLSGCIWFRWRLTTVMMMSWRRRLPASDVTRTPLPTADSNGPQCCAGGESSSPRYSRHSASQLHHLCTTSHTPHHCNLSWGNLMIRDQLGGEGQYFLYVF